jgi:hypothetical protein
MTKVPATKLPILNLPCTRPDERGNIGFTLGQFIQESQNAQKDMEENPQNYEIVTMGELATRARKADSRATKKKRVK